MVLDIGLEGDVVAGVGLVGVGERDIVVQLQADGVAQQLQAPVRVPLVQHRGGQEVPAHALVGQLVGLLVQSSTHLHRHRGNPVVTDFHQRTQAQVGDNQALGEQRHQGIVLPVHVGAHAEGGTGAGGVVQIHHRLRLVQAQDLQDLLRQYALGIVEGRAEAAIQVPGPGQHAMTEQRWLQCGHHRGHHAHHVDSGPLSGAQPAVQRHDPRGLVAV